MYLRYLFRELSKRRKQTALIASGLAIAIGLVVVVSAVSAGIKSAQAEALSGLYGIGTDISISKTTQPGDPRQRFEVGSGDGATSGSSRTFSKSMLRSSRFSGTITEDELSKIAGASGVARSVATLKLTSTTFNGELPDFVLNQTRPFGPGISGATGDFQRGPPTGGFDGNGGAAFDVTTFSVEGLGLGQNDLGPFASVDLSEGRLFTPSDAGAQVAIIDSNYASSETLSIGGTITMADTQFVVVGIVASNSASANTPSNVYIPIDVAQKLSSNLGLYSNVYVAAKSSADLANVKAAIEEAVPGATVSTSDEIASTVTGSLTTASSVVKDIGVWLSAIVLLAAFGMAILFTTSGVNRRIREFGTLKAIGWRSRRVVGQVVGESLVTGLIGGIVGIGIGLAGVWSVNNWAPSLSASAASAVTQLPGGPGGFGGAGVPSGAGGPGGFGGRGGGLVGQAAAPSIHLAMRAAVDPHVIGLAIGFAILGGLLAAAFGGLRAARLSPAAALRSVD